VVVDPIARAHVDCQLAVKRAGELDLLRVAFGEPLSTRVSDGWVWFSYGPIAFGRTDTGSVFVVEGGVFSAYTIDGDPIALGTQELLDVLADASPASQRAANLN
jgi:hypothetical protein